MTTGNLTYIFFKISQKHMMYQIAIYDMFCATFSIEVSKRQIFAEAFEWPSFAGIQEPKAFLA